MDFVSLFLASFFGVADAQGVSVAPSPSSSQVVVVDADNDGVAEDACPEIPASTPDGCPEYFSVPSGFVSGVTVSVSSEDFVLKDPRLIMEGDVVEVRLVDEDSDEVLARSKQRLVR